MTTDTIPEGVLAIMEVVRSGGETNMFDRNAVIALSLQAATDSEEQDDREAVVWLTGNKGRYMEALKAMGARRTR